MYKGRLKQGHARPRKPTRIARQGEALGAHRSVGLPRSTHRPRRGYMGTSVGGDALALRGGTQATRRSRGSYYRRSGTTDSPSLDVVCSYRQRARIVFNLVVLQGEVCIVQYSRGTRTCGHLCALRALPPLGLMRNSDAAGRTYRAFHSSGVAGHHLHGSRAGVTRSGKRRGQRATRPRKRAFVSHSSYPCGGRSGRHAY